MIVRYVTQPWGPAGLRPRKAAFTGPTSDGDAEHGRPPGWLARPGARNGDPPCAICSTTRGSRSETHLSHGVRVWLCEIHGSESFISRSQGRAFAERLLAAWRANGVATTRRIAALASHVRQVREVSRGRALPGSYSWPELRAEAEGRFAAGDDPRRVIAELRARHERDPARAPSRRTMRRWFQDGRWRRTPVGLPRLSRVRPAPYEIKKAPVLYSFLPWALTREHPASTVTYVRPVVRRRRPDP